MPTKTVRTAILLACLGSGVAWSQQQRQFDLGADFSPQKNPSGAWQYGYSATPTLEPSEFRIDKYSNRTVPVSFWHPEHTDQPGPGYYPYVAGNTAATTSYGSSKGWAVRADEIAMEASNTGQYSLVRFVAPKTGTYAVSAKFTGIHFGLSTTDVHVLHNAADLFTADIEGYGGDPAFHPIVGANPTANYEGQVTLKRGETLTFAVGYGRNKTNYGDTTGLIVHLTLLTKAEHKSRDQGQVSH